MNIGCVLMAAGTASRFGENKLLHEIDGHSLIARAVGAVPACLFARPVAVVSDPAVAAVVESAGYQAVYNPDPTRGQGTTIALGMAQMQGMDAVLFSVGDQPYLTRASVERLLAAWRPGDICALSYAGRRGNPVLFPAECLAELSALPPEATGKAVLLRHPQRLRLIEAGSARELHDIDIPEDLER